MAGNVGMTRITAEQEAARLNKQLQRTNRGEVVAVQFGNVWKPIYRLGHRKQRHAA